MPRVLPSQYSPTSLRLRLLGDSAAPEEPLLDWSGLWRCCKCRLGDEGGLTTPTRLCGAGEAIGGGGLYDGINYKGKTVSIYNQSVYMFTVMIMMIVMMMILNSN